MEKKINNNDFVKENIIEAYQEIDGFNVIEELLLFKGVDIAGATKSVDKKHLDDIALVVYNLESNSTNRLYVGMILDKFYLRNNLVCSSGKIRVPANIYDRVKKLNDSYKTKANQDSSEFLDTSELVAAMKSGLVICKKYKAQDSEQVLGIEYMFYNQNDYFERKGWASDIGSHFDRLENIFHYPKDWEIAGRIDERPWSKN